MSNGIAIIASDIEEFEIIKKNGVLIKNINQTKLQDELKKLMNNLVNKNLQKLSWNNSEHTSKKVRKAR